MDIIQANIKKYFDVPLNTEIKYKDILFEFYKAFPVGSNNSVKQVRYKMAEIYRKIGVDRLAIGKDLAEVFNYEVRSIMGIDEVRIVSIKVN